MASSSMTVTIKDIARALDISAAQPPIPFARSRLISNARKYAVTHKTDSQTPALHPAKYAIISPIHQSNTYRKRIQA